MVQIGTKIDLKNAFICIHIHMSTLQADIGNMDMSFSSHDHIHVLH